jgi:hypothetical protein
VVGEVIIRYLLFKEENGEAVVTADDVARWEYRAPNANGEYPPWQGVTRPKRPLLAGDHVRAVGVAVQATNYDQDPRVPPSITSLNWCVTREVKPEVKPDAQQLAADLSPTAVERPPVGTEAEPRS